MTHVTRAGEAIQASRQPQDSIRKNMEEARNRVALQNHDRLLRRDEVLRLTGLSNSSIWRLCRDGEFPASVRISAQRVGWSERAVQAWINEKLGAENATA